MAENGGVEPSPEEIAAARSERDAPISGEAPPDETTEAKIRRAERLLPKLVRRFQAAHPEIPVGADSFVVDPSIPGDALAMYHPADGRLHAPPAFVIDAVADYPAYDGVVLHELGGHRDFDGKQGDGGFQVGRKVFVAGEKSRFGNDHRLDAQTAGSLHNESEIYAYVREYGLGAGKVEGSAKVGSPEPLLTRRIDAIFDQWAPELAVPLLESLARRMEADPAVSDDALAWYRGLLSAAAAAHDKTE